MRDAQDQVDAARRVRLLLTEGAVGTLGDGELLERFATRSGDPAEAAFAALVARHGPMVLRACRSTLGDPHEAQDAFQATFLLLARRAGSLWVRDSLGPWLHSVACRVSAGSRAARGRRRALERRAAGRLARSPEGPGRDDLGPALHEEVERLPGRLRGPVVLCYLEGLTHEQAAEHLACPVGTVRSRLARGRERLRRGLARRGFAPPDPTVAMSTAPVPVPPSLASLAIQLARPAADRPAIGLVARWLIFLSEGVVQPMTIHPLKSAAVLLLASGAIAVGLRATSGQEPRPPDRAAPPPIDANPREKSADERRFEAIERRLRDLELKLEEVAPARRADPRAARPPFDQDTLVKIRPQFDKALVEKVFVAQGEFVKKGDPLFLIRSADMAAAKHELRAKFVQWDHDRKFLKAREPLAKAGRITQLVWTDTQNDEKKSRLDYLVARERLSSYGVPTGQIDGLVLGLADDPKAGDVGEPEQVRELSMITSVSPIDGVVVSRDAVAGNFYDRVDVLLIIAPPGNSPLRR